MRNTDNIFLNGPFAPWREEGEAFALEVEGQIPADLNGALFRAGSNQHFLPEDPARYHWFDGDGMVHAVFLRDGRAMYRNRYVQTDGLKLEMREGRAVFGGLINGPGKPWDPDGSLPPFKNPGNTHVGLFDDRLLVYCEMDVPHELRPDTLETVGKYDFHGRVSTPVTAHFKVDPGNGDLLFYGVTGDTMTWYRADRHGVLLDTHKFGMGAPCFVHDYAVTPNYAIFVISPQLFALDQIAAGGPSVIWDPETVPVARFAVLHRGTGEVRWLDAAEPFNTTHYYNAYESGSTIVVDAHRTHGSFGLTRPELAHYGADGDYNGWFGKVRAIATCWELDLAAGKVKEQAHTDVPGDFPRINDQRTGLKHRFLYYTTTRGIDVWGFDGLGKHDTALGRTEVTTIDGLGLTAPSEPVFVPREGATAEDEGWVLSIWWDPATDRSEVIVQDAQAFDAAPVARIKLNHRVPLGFHGSWAAAADLDAALASQDT